MAQVPYNPTSDIAPSSGGTPELRPNVTPDAFGVGIGEAIKGLGGSIAHVGDELFTRGLALQKLQNETVAKQADTDYMIKAGQLHAEFGALEGEARVAAYPKFAKDLQDARIEIRNRLGNLETQRMYDGQSLTTMGRSIFNGAGQAATAQRQWSAGVAASRRQANKDDIFANPNDDVAVRRGEIQIEADTRDEGDLHGWGQEKTDQEIKRQLSETRAGRIISMARTDPVKAAELFEKYRPSMTAKDIERSEATVDRQTYTTGARLIDAEVNKDLYDPDRKDDAKEIPLSERVQRAREMAEKQFPNNPLAVEAATKATEAGYNRFKQIETQDSRQAKETVGNALIGHSDPNGKLPTNMDELRLDPKAADAYDRLKASDKKSVLAALAKNAKGDVIETPERRDRFNQLKGMAQAFPADFLDTDIWKEDIPIQMKQQLQDMKFKVQKGQEIGQTKAVSAAMRDLEGTLRGAGVIPANKESYSKFRGALSGAMEGYQDVHKKPMPPDEIKRTGARLLNDSQPWFLPADRKFEGSVPESAAKAIRESPQWNGDTPNDELVRRIYNRQLYEQLYNAAATRDKNKGKPIPLMGPR